MTDPISTLNIEFIENHKPSLKSGEYTVNVEQTVLLKDSPKFDKPFSTNIKLAVFGERFSLQPQEIYASFPPAGSLGDWSTVLPHVVLSRSTLPWERSPISENSDNQPWLALLLFTEEEYQGEKPDVLPLQLLTLKELKERSGNPQNINLEDLAKKVIGSLSTELSTLLTEYATLSQKLDILQKELEEQEGKIQEIDKEVREKKEQKEKIEKRKKEVKVKISIGKTYFPEFNLEKSQNNEDPVTVIDVKRSLLGKILPSVDDLKYLAHVRHTKNEQTRSQEEPIAVVIGNRLPKQKVNNTVCLVSLENRYSSDRFDYQKTENDDYIRLVVLHSWQFTCVDPKYNFKDLLLNLNRDENSILRLPKPLTDTSKVAEQYLSSGYVPLHHNLRQGGKTISWYHSPFIPAANPAKIDLSTLSVFNADRLVCYDSEYGMFDVSYAAAWELGRLLALKDSQFSLNLCNWKREHIKELTKNNQQALYSHLFSSSEPQKNSETKQWSPNEWLKDLGLLKSVPFNYLVPDEQMLPIESIRFFHLDWFWVECLLGGAFSLGNSLGQKEVSNQLSKQQDISGFLLRSQVVAGWPDLQVEASSKLLNKEDLISNGTKLELLRYDRLSESVLLCLFTGEIKTLDISLKPQGLHFGFDTKNNVLCRSLRNPDGNENGKQVYLSSFKEEDKKAIDIDALAKNIYRELKINETKFTSAQFALQMIQGAEKVRFCHKK
jgi:hypothetical protein